MSNGTGKVYINDDYFMTFIKEFLPLDDDLLEMKDALRVGPPTPLEGAGFEVDFAWDTEPGQTKAKHIDKQWEEAAYPNQAVREASAELLRALDDAERGVNGSADRIKRWRKALDLLLKQKTPTQSKRPKKKAA